MLAAIMAVSAVLALIWYATTPRRYEYNVLYGPANYGPANLCAVDRFELGRVRGHAQCARCARLEVGWRQP